MPLRCEKPAQAACRRRRAGRALPDAWGILLSGREDDDIAEFFIDQAFPPVEQQRAIVDALGSRPTMTATELEQVVDLPRGRIAAMRAYYDVLEKKPPRPQPRPAATFRFDRADNLLTLQPAQAAHPAAAASGSGGSGTIR